MELNQIGLNEINFDQIGSYVREPIGSSRIKSDETGSNEIG